MGHGHPQGEHQPVELWGMGAPKASITSISRWNCGAWAAPRRASRASAGGIVGHGRPQGGHHEHQPVELWGMGGPKAGITSISRWNCGAWAAPRRASLASAGGIVRHGRPKASITSISRWNCGAWAPPRRASRASAGGIVGHGRPQGEHHEHQPVELWGMGAPKASITSISRWNCGAWAPPRRASRASAGGIVGHGRPQGEHHEHQPVELWGMGTPKASITSICRWNCGAWAPQGEHHEHQPGNCGPWAPQGEHHEHQPVELWGMGAQGEHHEHQPVELWGMGAPKASITSISRWNCGAWAPPRRASRASAGGIVGHGRPQGEHHEHQPVELWGMGAPRRASRASAGGIVGHGHPQGEHHEHLPVELWGMGAPRRASRASAGGIVGHGRPQGEHHEHQPVELWGMGAPKASITSISRWNCGACAPPRRASRASAGGIVGHGRPQGEHHEHQPVELWGMGAPKASITSISRWNCGAWALKALLESLLIPLTACSGDQLAFSTSMNPPPLYCCASSVRKPAASPAARFRV